LNGTAFDVSLCSEWSTFLLDASAGSCTSDIDAVLARGDCTRCWPATRALCTQGRPNVVQGMTACLTGTFNGTPVCWDFGDPNTAGPCVQYVIDMNADDRVRAVQAKLTSLGCNHYVLLLGSVAAMMSDADRVKVAGCASALTTCDGTAIVACLSGTAFDATLCKN
jgi:hypothetical protein